MDINKLVYLISTTDMLIFGLIMSAIVPHLLSLGSSHSAIGFQNSFIALVQFISNPLFGSISDTKGRKFTLLRTLALGVFSNVLLTMTYTSYLGIFFYRILHAISNQTMVLIKAVIADNVPSDKQAAVFGNLGAFAALGFILAPIISGITLETEGGFYNLALLMIVFTAANSGIALLLPDSAPAKQDKEEKEKPAQLSLIKTASQGLIKVLNNFKAINWELYWDIFLLKLLVEVSFQTFYASFGLMLHDKFDFSHKQIGYMLAMHAVLIVVFNLLYSTIKAKLYSNDTTGQERMRHVFLLLIITFAGFSTAPVWWIYGLFLIPISCVRAVVDSTQTEILVLRTGEADKGTVMGAFESIMSLAGLTVPLVTGFATDMWGCTAPSVLALIPSIGSIYVVNKMQAIAEKKTN